MNTIRLSILIQSQISDALVEMEGSPESAAERLQFVKFLIHFNTDLNCQVDPSEEFEKFTEFSNR